MGHRQRYPDQWVALVEMDWADETVARVAGHGTRRGAPFDQMRAAGLRYETIGHFFTGRILPRGFNFIGLLVPEMAPQSQGDGRRHGVRPPEHRHHQAWTARRR